MEFHSTETTSPAFEFNVIGGYDDPLRRQLCEGLHILNTGTMNRRMEFNDNLICRMQDVDIATMGEGHLKQELTQRHTFIEMIGDFVHVMSILNLNKVQDMPDPDSSECDMIAHSSAHNDINCGTNENYTCRSSPLTPRGKAVGVKRKRAAMETSTPTQLRRETKLIDLGESPIGQALSDQDSQQNSTDGSG